MNAPPIVRAFTAPHRVAPAEDDGVARGITARVHRALVGGWEVVVVALAGTVDMRAASL